MLRGFNSYIRQLECAAYIVIVQQLSYTYLFLVLGVMLATLIHLKIYQILQSRE